MYIRGTLRIFVLLLIKNALKMAIVTENIEVFVGKLKTASPSNRKKMCKGLVDELRIDYKATTIRTYLTRYRKAIGALGTGFSDLVHLLTLPKEEVKAQQKKYNLEIYNQQSSLIKINTEALIALGTSLIHENSYMKVSLGIAILTGRREAEVLKTGIFTPHKNRKFEVLFEGQLKTKGEEREAYPIPTLIDAKTIINAMGRLRELTANKRGEKDFQYLTNDQLNKVVSKDLGLYVKQIFGELLGEGCKVHSLRKAYSAICLSKFKPVGMADNLYLSKILGHGEGDTTTANTYHLYYV